LNYLAHIALSPEDPDIMLGNFIADSVRPNDVEQWSSGIQEGYELHKGIDKYTDAHPAFKSAVKRLRDNHKKYAPVVLDILNDHLLGKYWKRYEVTDFNKWSEAIYKKLEGFGEFQFPPKAERLYDGLMKHRYLHVYQSREGIEGVLSRMDKRARFTSNFVQGASDLYEDISFYEAKFDELYGDLQKEFCE